MRADVSRRTFDPGKHYSAVLQEQGRMLTDADLEEEHRILARRIPRASLHIVHGGGHLFLLERPAEVAALVADFLAPVTPGDLTSQA